MAVATRAARRFLSLFTATALLAGLMVGTPSAARAAHAPDWYVAKAGVDYTGVAGCDDPDVLTSDFASDDLAVQDIIDSGSFLSTHIINFCEGEFLFESEVTIDRGEVYIEGTASDEVTISGGESTRLFNISGEVFVSRITMVDGWVGGTNMGGAILAGQISVIYSAFEDNYASGGGGALATYSDGSVSITMSEFSRNTANDMGGAVGAYGNVSVVGSEFTNNTSHADVNCTGGGGAIAAGGSVTVLDGVFRGNRAEVDREDLDACNWNPIELVTDPYDGALGGLGGAIAAIGRVDLEGGLYTGNFAEAGGGAVMAAGRDFSNSCVTSSLVLGATFTNNSTNPRLARAPRSDAYGGGVLFGGGALLTGTCDLNIAASTFTGNSSMAVGGAVNGTDVTVHDSTFTGNSVKGSINAIPEEFRFAGGLGGGAIAGIQVNAIDSTFLRNSGPSGGAILTVGGCAIMQSNTFTGNQATARGTGYGGGAVHAMQLFCSSVFTDNLFSSNSAAGDGGALWGGVWTFGDELSAAQIKSIIEAPEGWSTNNTYSRNRAVNGGAIVFSTRLPTRVRYSTRRIERTNRVMGNRGGRNPILAVVNWGP
jgi:hypothetical protein